LYEQPFFYDLLRRNDEKEHITGCLHVFSDGFGLRKNHAACW